MINRKVTDPIDIPKYVGVVREMVDGKPAGHVWTSGKLTNVPTTASGTAIGVGVTGAKAGTLIRKSAASSASVPDVLADAVFPLDVVVRSANVDQLQTKLSTTFLQLIKEDTKIAGKGLEAWKTIKSKDGIVHQRKKILLPGTVAGSALTASEFNRTMFRVNVDPERAFQILSKPEHQRLITDSFSGAIEIKRFDENSTVWFYKYRFGKTPTADRLIKVLEFRRKRISLSQDSETNMSDSTVKGAASRPVAWMVVYRSISSITPDEEPQGIAESLESIPPPVGGDDFGDVTRPQRDVEDASQSRIDQDFGVEEAAQPSTDDWAESLEDRELAESLRAFASQSSLTKSEISPLVSIAKGEAPPVLPLVPGIAVAPTPPATPAVGPGDSVPQQIPLPKAPQPLNQSSSASSMSSNSGRGTGSPAPAGSRLPSIIGRAAAGGADKGTVVKGDGGFPLDDPLHVHVYGYFVESIPDDPHGCNVTMLTQYSSKSIQRLESSWDIGRQLKNSIEELATLSSALPNDGAGDDPALQTVARRNRSGRPLSGADEEGKAPSTSGQRMDRLKSLASDAGKKAYSWWSGKSGSQSSTIGNAVAAGAVISSTFESPDNTLSSSKLLADSAHVHTVAFDDLDSDDDGTSEYDYRSDDDGGTLPKEAMRRTRVGRLLMRKAADKTGSLRPPEEAGEVASLHSQADEGEAVEARSLAESLDDDASGLRDAESMTGLSDVGPPAGLGFTGVPSAPERSERPGPSDIRKNAFQEFAITAKQGARLDVGFNGDFSTATELAWEFKVRSPDAVNFAVLFKPTMGKRISTSSLGGTDDRFLRNLADSELEPGAKIVVPLTPVFAMTRAVRGRIATSGFPAGIFVVLWDNAYHRKTDKTLAYRVRLQPIRVHSTPRIPRPHFSQEMSSAVVVRTRSAFRVQLFYTEEVERLSVHGAPSPSQNPDRGQTYIQWEFSTGGSDIFFKIYYTPAEPDYLGTIRASTSEHPVDGTVPLVAPALPPRAIPAPGAALPLAPSGLGSSPPTTPRSLPIAPSADSARSLSSSPVSLGPPATIPDAPSGRSLSWGPAVSSLATVSAPGTAAVPPTPPSRNVVIVPQVKCNSAKGSISGSLLITVGILLLLNTGNLLINRPFKSG